MKKTTKAAVIITKPTFHGHMVPLGYLYVVAALKEAGFQTVAVESDAGEEAGTKTLAEAIDATGAELVVTGTSYKFHNNCPSSTIESAMAVARAAKESDPGRRVLLIGPLNAALYDSLLKEPAVDAAALGEPEGICADVAAAVRDGKPWCDIPGLALRGPDGAAMTGIREYPDPDALPFPDRDAIDFKEHIAHSYFSPQTTEVLTSRGCPFNCSYCFGARTSRRNSVNSGAPFRGASPERVVEEIGLLYDRWGVRGIKFSDVEFCASSARVENICSLILAKGYKDLRWRAVTHAKSVKPELLKLMRSAGCANIYYGVESGDDRMLRVMNKKAALEDVREAFRRTREAGIKPEASFLLGVPGETEESAENTIRFSMEIMPFVATFHVFLPYPGIPLESLMKKEDAQPLDDWDVYQLRVGKSYCDIPPERLETLSKKAYRRFYLRPSKIMELILCALREPTMRGYIFQIIAGKREGSWLRKMLLGRRRLGKDPGAKRRENR